MSLRQVLKRCEAPVKSQRQAVVPTAAQLLIQPSFTEPNFHAITPAMAPENALMISGS